MTSPDSDPSRSRPASRGRRWCQPDDSCCESGRRLRQVQRSPSVEPVGAVGETESTIPQAHSALIEAGAEALERRQIARPGRAPHDPPQAVVTVRIPLPTSDESRLVKDRSPCSARSLSRRGGCRSRFDGRCPRCTNRSAAGRRRRIPNGGSPSRDMRERSAATGQIEQWPYGPQAAASVAKRLERSVARQRIRPDSRRRIPSGRRQGERQTRLPFLRSAKRRRLRTTGRTPQAPPPIAAAAPQPAASTPPAMELHVVPAVEAPPTANRPALIPDRSGRIRVASVEEQSGSSERIDSQERPEPEQPPQMAPQGPPRTDAPPSAGSSTPVATAVQTSAALPTQPAAAPVAQTPAVRSPQWTGGRYGQPAWMAPYATPAIPAVTSALSTSGIRVGCQAHRSGWVWHPEHKMETRFLRSYGQGGS